MSEILRIDRPVCCGRSMHKAGFIWSGRRKVQRYKCNKCGRTTIKKIDIIGNVR